jgi:hypothetical protein
MKDKLYKIVTFVPLSHTDKVRDAIGKAGAGVLGEYDFCSFSVRGTGRFKGTEKSKPFLGKPGNLESVDEERIEFTCGEDRLDDVVKAIKSVHPYEEIPIDVYSLENIKKLQ